MITMELEAGAEVLRRMRVRQLEPELMKEVLEFAGETGYEGTLKASSRLNILLDIYNAEKAKEKRSRKMLKKAEKLIMKLASLTYTAEVAERRRREEKSGERRQFPRAAQMEITLSERIRKLFGSVGIKDENAMARAVELHGDKGVEDRVELLLASTLGQPLVQTLFGMKPAMFLEPDDRFVASLSDMETKKEIVDRWADARGTAPGRRPYDSLPEILFEDYPRLNQILGLARKEESEPAPAMAGEGAVAAYQPKPMRTRDMLAVLAAAGYIRARKTGEITLTRADGRTLTISDPHDGEYSKATVRRIIRDAGMTPGEFEAARQRAL
jgi:hypothetical protein